MYEAVLNKRNTHINILIIIATASFYENKKLSIFSYLTLIIYSFLSYSRIELILLLSIIFCTMNFNKKFNLSIYFSFFIFGIITIFYRFYLSDQNFLYVFMDPLHLNINTFNLIDNYNIKELIFLFTENLKFILNDFFYIKQNLHNFFQNNSLPTYSKKGIDTVLLYIIPFIFYFYILVFLRKYFFVTQFFLSSIFVFLIISLFRGNFVHNIGFIIKLYIMILISEWIVRKIKLWLSREA